MRTFPPLNLCLDGSNGVGALSFQSEGPSICSDKDLHCFAGWVRLCADQTALVAHVLVLSESPHSPPVPDCKQLQWQRKCTRLPAENNGLILLVSEGARSIIYSLRYNSELIHQAPTNRLEDSWDFGCACR